MIKTNLNQSTQNHDWIKKNKYFKSFLKIKIVGQGLTGQSFEKFCQSRALNYEFITLPAQPTTLEIQEAARELKGCVLFISPGLKPIWKGIFLQYQICFFSDFDLFHFYVQADCAFYITGTNGKTTTVQALAHVLKVSRKKSVFILGNIGRPFLDDLERITESSIIIAELSSFQLFWSERLKRSELKMKKIFGAITQLEQDHLNWHESFENYKQCKYKLESACDFFLPPESVEKINTFQQQKLSEKQIQTLLSWPIPLQLNSFPLLKLLSSWQNLTIDEIFKALETFQTSTARAKILTQGPYQIIDDAKATNIAAVKALYYHLSQKNHDKKNNSYQSSKQNSHIFKTLWILGGDLKSQSPQDLEFLFQDQSVDIALATKQKREWGAYWEISTYKATSLIQLLKKLDDISKELRYNTIVFSPGGSFQPELASYQEASEKFLQHFSLSS